MYQGEKTDTNNKKPQQQTYLMSVLINLTFNIMDQWNNFLIKANCISISVRGILMLGFKKILRPNPAAPRLRQDFRKQ